MGPLHLSIRRIRSFNYFRDPNFLTILLIGIIFSVCCFIDIETENSQLIFPIATAIICSNGLTKWGIKKLKAIKLNQFIKKEGPEKHQKKSGTPSMGGILIIPLGLVLGIIINLNQGINKEIIAISILSIGFMLIGAIDDLKSYSLKQNTGLNPKEKLLMQLIIGLIFLMFCYSNNLISSKIHIFNNQSLELNSLIWIVAIFVLLAESNATNLTDGLDGLASGCGAIVLTGLSVEFIIRGTPKDLSLASFCIIMCGVWLGFLLNNKNPAKIFMGDTGSLAMGAFLAGVALISNSLWSLLIMGIVFLAESISVILQVGYFKLSKRLTGKGHRLLKMAPLHHHFELSGQEEIEIVRNFWLISISFVLIRLFLFK